MNGYKWAIYTMAMLNNQRVYVVISEPPWARGCAFWIYTGGLGLEIPIKINELNGRYMFHCHV